MASENSRDLEKPKAGYKQKTERLLLKAAEQQAEFVLTELDTAVTFSEIALSTSNLERRARNIENAVTGYKTALHFSLGRGKTITSQQVFQDKIAHLEDLLRELGEDV